jgi:hypothetical protein
LRELGPITASRTLVASTLPLVSGPDLLGKITGLSVSP